MPHQMKEKAGSCLQKEEHLISNMISNKKMRGEEERRGEERRGRAS